MLEYDYVISNCNLRDYFVTYIIFCTQLFRDIPDIIKPKLILMKTVFIISGLVLFILLGCKQVDVTTSNPVEGAWQVVSWQNFAGDSLVMELGKNFVGTEMKVWSKSHFAFAGRYKRDTTFIDNCGGGSYKLNGTHAEENIMYFPNQSTVGTTIKLLYEIKNDTLIQTFPVDENWQIDKSNYSIQKLIRLE